MFIGGAVQTTLAPPPEATWEYSGVVARSVARPLVGQEQEVLHAHEEHDRAEDDQQDADRGEGGVAVEYQIHPGEHRRQHPHADHGHSSLVFHVVAHHTKMDKLGAWFSAEIAG